MPITKLKTIFLVSIVTAFSSIANQQFASSAPTAITNNATTQVLVNDKHYLISFSGLGSGKDYKDVHNSTYVYDVNKKQWEQKKSVPIEQPINGLVGRLASVATSINDTAYVFGGYTVAKDHSEVSVPDVYSYQVNMDEYKKLAPMPVPVDDSIAMTYQQKYIYLISGWHNDGNVNLVQVYDTHSDTWAQASPFPGKPVFGHAGGIVDNIIVVCDGVRIDVHKKSRRTYAAENSCYRGEISSTNPLKINWQALEHPTRVSRYRMAASGFINYKSDKKEVIFIGGSDNPYNYSGIGYNGIPSQPSNEIWRYDIERNTWDITQSKTATMDHRGLLRLGDKLITVGGMGPNQKVLNSINTY